MNILYIKKIFLETKELFTSQALIAILSLVQVSYVVKQLGPEKYGVITLLITFISLFFRALHSKNSDVALLAFKKEDKNIFYPALLFDFFIGVFAMILCLTIKCFLRFFTLVLKLEKLLARLNILKKLLQ